MATDATSPRARRARARVAPETLTWVAFGALLVVAAAFLLHETRGTTFWFDEWVWILDRRGNDLDTFLEPHNEHLSLIPVAIYKLLFATAGLDHYGPWRVLVTAAHLGLATLVFVYTKRRVGGLLALCAAALLLFLGPGWQNIVWPFQVGWLSSLTAGVGALLALDRGDRRGEVLACGLLAVALASSGLGVAIAIGLLVELAWERRWRDVWIVALPIVPYAIWWLAYRPAGIVQANIDQTFDFTVDAAAGALSSLVGLAGSGVPDGVDALSWGRPLGVAALVLLAILLPRYARIPARIVSLATILVAFLALTGLRRALLQDPDTSRYLYVSGLFILLLVAELARGVRVGRGIAAIAVVVTAAAVITNAGTLRDAGRYLRVQAEAARADLAAIELGRDRLKPGFAAAQFPGTPFITLRADTYLDAAAQYGSPAYSTSELASAPEAARMVADAQLVQLYGTDLNVAAAPAAGNAPQMVGAADGEARPKGPCVELTPQTIRAADAAPSVEVTVPARGLLVRAGGAPAAVEVRRFADGFTHTPHNLVAPSTGATLRFPQDAAPQLWHARVASQERVSVCGLR